MGTSVRIAQKLKGGALDTEPGKAPGPGNYNVSGNRSKITGGVFGVKLQSSLGGKSDNNLGPGQYVIPGSFDKSTKQRGKSTFGSSRT